MTITYPDVADTERLGLAAQQLHHVVRGLGCSIVLSGREVGAPDPDEYCPGEVAFLVDHWCYRSGFSTRGVFSPAQSINARVCAEHEQVMAGRPGFIRSRHYRQVATR